MNMKFCMHNLKRQFNFKKLQFYGKTVFYYFLSTWFFKPWNILKRQPLLTLLNIPNENIYFFIYLIVAKNYINTQNLETLSREQGYPEKWMHYHSSYTLNLECVCLSITVGQNGKIK